MTDYEAAGRKPLFEGLPPMDEDTASLVPMAEILRDAVYGHLYPTGETQLTLPSVDAMYDRAMQLVMERLIEQKVGALTPVEFAEAYCKIEGDEALLAALGTIKAVRGAQLERQAYIASLYQETSRTGQLRLERLQPDEVLRIGLFDPSLPHLASKQNSDNSKFRPLHRVLQLRLVEPDSGAVEIINDVWQGATWSDSLKTPPIEPYTRGKLGSRRVADETAPLDPILNLQGPIVIETEEGDTFSPPQIIGYVETLDKTLLLNGD